MVSVPNRRVRTLERETKNTVRFAEDEAGKPADHPGTPVVGTLYLQKAAHTTLGAPSQITVTIEARGEAGIAHP